MILKVIQEGTPTKKYTDIKSTATFVEKSFKEGKYSFILMYKDFGCDPNPILIGIKDLAILKHKSISTYEGVIEHLGIKELGSDMQVDSHYKLTISEIQIGL